MVFQGYSINGVPLHNSTRGWRLLREGTATQGGINNILNKVEAVGRGGYVPAISTFSEQIIVFNVRTARAGLESLLALAQSATKLTRTDDATKEMNVELASAIPSGNGPFDEMFNVTITLSAYEGVWRDVTALDVGPFTISSPTQTLTILGGVGAPISDAMIFIGGIFGQFTLKDAGGSMLKTTRLWGAPFGGTSSTGLLYFAATGQAFLAQVSDPWTPVADRSQYLDTSGGGGGFQLTPSLTVGNPTERYVVLTLTTLTQTSTTLRVKAKRSHRSN